MTNARLNNQRCWRQNNTGHDVSYSERNWKFLHRYRKREYHGVHPGGAAVVGQERIGHNGQKRQRTCNHCIGRNVHVDFFIRAGA